MQNINPFGIRSETCQVKLFRNKTAKWKKAPAQKDENRIQENQFWGDFWCIGNDHQIEINAETL